MMWILTRDIDVISRTRPDENGGLQQRYSVDLGEYEEDERRPAVERVRPLPLARLRMVLLPEEPRALPLALQIADEVLPQLGVHLRSSGARAMRGARRGASGVWGRAPSRFERRRLGGTSAARAACGPSACA